MRIVKLVLENIKCWTGRHEFSFKKYNAFIGENSSRKSSIQEAIFSVISGDINANLFTVGSIKRNLIFLDLELFEKDFKRIFTDLESSNVSPLILSIIKQRKLFLKNLSCTYFRSQDEHEKKHRGNNIGVKYEHLEEIQDPDIFENRDCEFPMRLDAVLRTLVYHEEDVSPGIFRNANDERFVTEGQIDAAIHAISNFIIDYIKNNIHWIQSIRKIETENISSSFSLGGQYSGKDLKKLLSEASNSSELYCRGNFEKFQEIVESWSFSPGRPGIELKSGGPVDIYYEKPDGTSINISQVGDGIKEATIIAGLFLIYPEKVFLVEEPELHLHPRALRELRDMLKYETEGQVILSTHNPVFINNLDEEVIIYKLRRNKEGSHAITIENKKGLLEFKNSYGLRNSDFLFEDILVFVEGPIDVSVFGQWFELFYPENLSVKFLSVSGKPNIPKVITLSFMLSLEQIFSYFVVLDKDYDNSQEIKENILKKLEGHSPELLTEKNKRELNNRIYILNKKNLEEYFLKAPRVIAEFLEIKENIVKEFIDNSSMHMIRKLSHLFKKYGKDDKQIFKKSKHIPQLAKMMEKHDIHPEIVVLFKKILNEYILNH